MNYKEAVRFFDEIPYFSKDPSNDNIVKILKKMENPECHMKFFHVAGTNGKGSVCAFLDSILRKGGYKTALFTSPHLVKINERIKINGEDISDKDFAYYLERILTIAEEPLSFFEYLFLMSILYFSEKNADYCILETGLGGTYDSTNVVTPEISIITSIGLDHTKILGDTLEQIAAEKAGIIKDGKPVVYFAQTPEVNQVIEEKACVKRSKIIKLSKEDIKIKENRKKCIAFSVESGYHRFDDLKISSYAEYQLWNADIAIHAIKEMIPGISDETIRSGLADMRWPARMEEIEPGIILDGAHNPHAIRAWVQTVRMQFPDQKKRLLFAVVADKDYEEMISIICTAFQFERITITCIPGQRKADPRMIKDIFERYTDTEVVIEEDLSLAYSRAKSADEGYLFCLGSLYLAGMIEELLI
ncbi:MAG: folylpolyglutamate synthase/dihydrofolate synthase family protein [Lachnospiraceae bacterium]|nr:folylpolyglutamate synthase/dihydrofolate synthase family protein [Lachnospiraceae bacterium]